MIEVLRHRGPDDTGFFSDRGVGLANARLSIIDLEGGHQPIRNEDGTVYVTYNGEIYNFRELRQKLESLGHSFYTRSDTEVIVHGYEQYGEEFVKQLNGMFAFGLWDSKSNKLVLARDRLGVKPLFYMLYKGSLLFASEIKGILQAPFPREVDLESLYAILNLGYIPGSGTLIEGVRKLPASNILVFKDSSMRISSYWDFPSIDDTINEDESVESLRLALKQTVQDQLVADVPVGCFLSGGLDTSTIVAFASKISDRPIQTFCMGFGDDTDEFKDAKLIADRFGADHHELIVESSLGMRTYPTMVWHMEAPKYNLYPWFVCELVRRHVKVCLSGNGGDEVFGGYFTRYQNALKIQALSKNRIVGNFRALGALLEKVAPDLRTKNRMRVMASLGDDVSAYLVLSGVFPESFNSRLFKKAVGGDSLRKHYSRFFGHTDFLQGLLNSELRTKLVDDLLVVDDTMSMAHSLELRVPLLDNRIVELMTKIPWRMKYEEGTYGKLLLRKAVQEILPKESMSKPKWGFSVNVYRWYSGELGELAKQILPESNVVEKYFSMQIVRKLLSKPLSEKNRRYYVLLWQLLGFHFWHRIFIDSDKVGERRLEIDALAA